ncbi:MAG TPA: DUF1439 domain-containing protein [Burkholderiaceae bacterium]|nr:DUF1439 domain-containing protein [Burkholderiaceae bacterium]
MSSQVRKFGLVAVSFGLAVGLSTLGETSQAAPRVIALSPADVQAGIAETFPQRRCLLGLACVTLVDPRVRLIDGDSRIYLSAVAVPEVGGDRLRGGVVEARGAPRYEPASGAFYIDQPDVTRIDFPGLPAPQARMAADVARLLLAEAVREPVWRLDERDGRQALAKLVLRGVEVRNGRLLLEIGGNDDPMPYDDDLASPGDLTPGASR